MNGAFFITAKNKYYEKVICKINVIFYIFIDINKQKSIKNTTKIIF